MLSLRFPGNDLKLGGRPDLLRLAGMTNIAAAYRRYAAQPALALAVAGLTWQR